jgi:hypothetical protein
MATALGGRLKIVLHHIGACADEKVRAGSPNNNNRRVRNNGDRMMEYANVVLLGVAGVGAITVMSGMLLLARRPR